MQLKDGKRFFSLNTDDHPSQMAEGDVSDALNIRMGSSDSQHESGIAETLQGELGVLINPDSLIVYYGQAVGGSFVYPGFEEIRVGSQVWMKKNWDAKYPGSKVYNDDENNRDVYGGLYTHGQILASDFCPDGWHVPTEAEVDILIAELLGAAVAGGKMKDIGWWDAPNTGADDSSGFKAMPGGEFDTVFHLLGTNGLLWLADEVTPTEVTITTTIVGLFGIYLKGFGDVTIDWGDGSVIETIILSSSRTLFTHTFAAGGIIHIINAQSITWIEAQVQSITAVTGLQYCVDIEHIDFTFNGLTSFDTYSWLKLKFIELQLNNISAITTFDWPDLEYFDCSSNSAISSLVTHNTWTKVKDIGMTGCNLSSFTAYAEWVDLHILNLGYNNITSLVTYPWINMTSIGIAGNKITSVTEINNILVNLLSSVVSMGTAFLEGSTNAIPTGAGIAAKTTMIDDRFWTVTTN